MSVSAITKAPRIRGMEHNAASSETVSDEVVIERNAWVRMTSDSSPVIFNR